MAKLTDADVLEMRRVFAAGGCTKKELGRRFGVSGVMASLIIRRKMWAHI
jgi:hypothetical protein